MAITIAPFTVRRNYNSTALSVMHEKQEQGKRDYLPITYWGIYMDDKHISYTSSKELAERTKEWMEKWLGNKL